MMKRPILHRYKKPCIVTLSGPEGCGKSTNQAFLVEIARSNDLNAIAVKGDQLTCGHIMRRLLNRIYPKSRRKRQFKVDPAPIINRINAKPCATKWSFKNRLKAHRRGLCYLIDGFVFRCFLFSRSFQNLDLIVLDRFDYDNLAKIIEYLPKTAKLVHRVNQKPDIPLLILANLNDLVDRRTGSSLEYYNMSLRRFQKLQELCPELRVIHSGNLDNTQIQIKDHLAPLLSND